MRRISVRKDLLEWKPDMLRGYSLCFMYSSVRFAGWDFVHVCPSDIAVVYLLRPRSKHESLQIYTTMMLELRFEEIWTNLPFCCVLLSLTLLSASPQTLLFISMITVHSVVVDYCCRRNHGMHTLSVILLMYVAVICKSINQTDGIISICLQIVHLKPKPCWQIVRKCSVVLLLHAHQNIWLVAVIQWHQDHF